MAEKRDYDSSTPKDSRMVCCATFSNDPDSGNHSEGNVRKKHCSLNQYGTLYLEANLEGSQVSDVELHSDVSDVESEAPDVKLDKEIRDGKHDMEVCDSEHDKEGDDEEDFTCNICKTLCTGLLSYRVHINSKRHIKNLKKAEIIKQLKIDKVIPDDDELLKDDSLKGLIISENGFYCHICYKMCSDPEPYKQHLESDRHRKKLEMKNLFMDTPCEGATGSSESDDKASFSCDICNKVFAGPFTYQQHIEDPSHLQLVEEAAIIEKYKERLQSIEDKHMTQCTLCNKFFTGPIPYECHMRSNAHLKIVQRMKRAVMISEKYPELVVLSTIKGDGREEYTISCGVCNITLTGPETAKQHAEGQKHKNMMKETSELEYKW